MQGAPLFDPNLDLDRDLNLNHDFDPGITNTRTRPKVPRLDTSRTSSALLSMIVVCVSRSVAEVLAAQSTAIGED